MNLFGVKYLTVFTFSFFYLTYSLAQTTEESFDSILARTVAEKPEVSLKQKNLLEERYDLSDRPKKDVHMFRGKHIQEGIRVKLPTPLIWYNLSSLTPEQIKEQDLLPKGFMPLSHPKQAEGGMLFPKFHIDELKKQTDRDLTRFDLDLDIPDHFLPEFPPPIFLTTRKDLGDVSQGKLVTTENFYEIFSKILNPKQLDGLRLLVTPFPQQQFNLTNDRRSLRPSMGVSCLDCHANGHTNGATHLVGDIRPQHFRNRIETPSLRGVNIQRLFGSQRALRSIEDFTEFEQRAAYFDADIPQAVKKGVNILDRGAQVHHMAEMQEIFDFPPAPKLDPMTGRLIPALASAQELRGENVFFNKANCVSCHTPPFYTDNMMHDLGLERFYKMREINGMSTKPDGPIKTFPLRGIKDSPPYLHDGRLLTLDDTVEFFNLVTGVKLTVHEKEDLVAFLLAL